jgi:thiamine-phosphate pyrophosphorylase
MKEHKLEILKNAGIYLVTSSEFSNRPTLQIIGQALASGCRLFQLREKNISKKELFELASEAKKLAQKFPSVFIINDHIDIAMAVGADGIHLGQDDLPVGQARKICGDKLIIGVSTHNKEEILKAQDEGADYINIGPVFSTNTKPHAVSLGFDGLAKLLPFVKIPFTLMGGIKEDNIKGLVGLKPAAVAMVTEITMAADIKIKINNLFNSIYSFNSLC